MTSNEQRIHIIGDQRAQLNLRALADLVIPAQALCPQKR
jgi:hypothetical protein